MSEKPEVPLDLVDTYQAFLNAIHGRPLHTAITDGHRIAAALLVVASELQRANDRAEEQAELAAYHAERENERGTP